MSQRKRYYQLGLPETLKESLEDLFYKHKNVKKHYDDNKVKFIEDATRRLIVFYEELYKGEGRGDS